MFTMSLPSKTTGLCLKLVGRWLHRRNGNLADIFCRNISDSNATCQPAGSSSSLGRSTSFNSRMCPYYTCYRHMQTTTNTAPLTVMPSNHDYLSCNDDSMRATLMNDMLVFENFITEDEEKSLLNEVEPYLKRLRYEVDHWDNAIHGYRETERRNWNEANSVILDRVRNLAFPPSVSQIAFVHVLDLTADGVIKPHVDSVRFCGDTIAGLSLLSPSVMRLTHEQKKDITADFLLSQRSLYIMRASARYDYSHEILGNDNSYFMGKKVQKGRRISVICRNQPMTQ